MDKIWLIVQREYLTRVRKKSFLIMSLIGPLLTVALFAVPVLIARMADNGKVVAVADAGNLFAGQLPEPKDDIRFVAAAPDLAQAKEEFKKGKYDALLYVPKLDLANPGGFQVFSRKGLSLSLETDVKRAVNRQIENQRLAQSGIDRATLDKLKVDVDLQTVSLSDEGEKSSSTGISTGVAYFCGFLIYMFIFIYGVQIMRGVMEEKTSRIVEVVISTVKPFQLMMGKVLGIAAVGLTQLGIWVLLSMGISTVMAGSISPDKVVEARAAQATAVVRQDTPAQQAAKKETNIAAKFSNALRNADLNVPLLIGCFLFYFLGGYLFYGALFGAIGSAVDNDTDTQQFMMPVTMPLILAFVVSQAILTTNPNGTVAFWMSMIPFTSPIAMMMRLPFGGVPAWQLALSMALLVAGFVFTTWLAGRIYRVGILMYGKKVNYRELAKWMFYKA
ncbi:ABC transporter permease [Hymenobacter weizhouensis]|uniref:ABC transporter permease n=1 Tax=Hymenobacter sp. YIM 151500-1 TaxID=2987689 RepID=UPI002227FD9B|nr:ABC transporter permease [Hymenobacter sp. YIM 151500-1]UYZ65163.1 ABC transporter permease [Hymenobacter sp. YIM 151500-1]